MSSLRFQNALKQIPQKVPPIWMMRQAGRYHSHYQALRANHSFEELCKNPELAAEVALGPIQDFDFDVAILFSDILFPLEALGFGLKYTEQGPKLGFQLSEATKPQLKPASEVCEFLRFQGEAVGLTRAKLPKDKSLVGFVGGLWTLFVYACEGGHSGSLVQTKSRLQLLPWFMEQIEQLHRWTIERQLAAGAEVVMIFDTAAGEISPRLFQQIVLPWLTKLAKQFPGKLGYYSKGTQSSFLSPEFLALRWAGLGFDHRWDLPIWMKQSKQQLSAPGFTQGNFDQALLHADFSSFKKHLDDYLTTWKEIPVELRAGWVSGLGHGVLPKTPEAHVRFFVDTVRKELE